MLLLEVPYFPLNGLYGTLQAVDQRPTAYPSVEGPSVDLLAPFLVDLFNRSLSTGSVPSVFKAAYITPLLKKINVKNFHGSLTTVVRAQNDTTKTANITDTIFDRTLV